MYFFHSNTVNKLNQNIQTNLHYIGFQESLVFVFHVFYINSVQFSSVAQSCPTLCDPKIAACQASLSITNSRSSPKLMCIELMMPSNHLILCRPFLFLPSIFPSIRVFSNEPVLHIRWPKYWSCSFSVSPFNEYSGLISFRIDWFDLLAVLSRVFSNTRFQRHHT